MSASNVHWGTGYLVRVGGPGSNVIRKPACGASRLVYKSMSTEVEEDVKCRKCKAILKDPIEAAKHRRKLEDVKS